MFPLLSVFPFIQKTPPKKGEWHTLTPNPWRNKPLYWRVTESNLLEIFGFSPTQDILIDTASISQDIFVLKQALPHFKPGKIIKGLLIKPEVAMWLWNEGTINLSSFISTRSFCGHQPYLQIKFGDQIIDTYPVFSTKSTSWYEFVLNDDSVIRDINAISSTSTTRSIDEHHYWF